MIQPLSLNLNRARVSALAIGALGLVALGSVTLPRVIAPRETIVVHMPSTTLAQQALVVTPQNADSSACGTGAYVSGDMVGDASPAAVYSAMCPTPGR
jgi:hypothetical protein